MKTRMVLIADDGKILTDGKEYGRQIFLEVGRSADEFYEITNEEYAELEEDIS